MTDHLTAPHSAHPSSSAASSSAASSSAASSPAASSSDTTPSAPTSSAPTSSATTRPGVSRRRLLQGTAALGGLIAFGSAVTASTTPAFAASISRPDIISARGWGAAAAQGTLPRIDHRPGHLVIHHTTHVNSSDYSMEAAKEVARLIQRNHLRNGWSDTGQQFTVARGGQMLEGRQGSLAAVVDGTRFIEGAHAYGFNDQSVGIEVDGLYTSHLPTDAQWSSLVHLSAFICERYGIAVDNIMAHRDVPGAQTLCCGDAFYAKLPALRNEVEAALARGLDAGPGASRDYPTVRRGDEGDAVRRVQVTLTGIGHQPGAADGVFGQATEQAVREYQQSIGTGVDGVVGSKTWGALATHHAAGSTVRSGDSGTEVRYLQRGINAASGTSLVDDGRFGAQTESAVRSYQSSRNLASDGIAGPATWGALKKGR